MARTELSTEVLPCALTDAEVAERSTLMAKLVAELEKIEVEKKTDDERKDAMQAALPGIGKGKRGHKTVSASPAREPVVDDDERRRSFIADKGATSID